MIWEQLRDYLEFDTKDADWISFCVKKDYMIRVKALDANWYTGSYIQIITGPIGGTTIVIQLEGLPEDPYNSTNVFQTELPVQVFKALA